MISGIIWAGIPAAFAIKGYHGSAKLSLLLLIAGLLTGVAVSLALKSSLEKSNGIKPLLLGTGALPLGAFVFGLCFVLLDFIFGDPVNDGITITDALKVGFLFAFESICTPIAIILVPPACLTTILLKNHLQRGLKPL